MRFYYLIITFFLLVLNLFAQSSDAFKLSSQQITLIQSQGAEGIQTVLGELGIPVKDLSHVEAFVSEAVSQMITEPVSAEKITTITSDITIALSEVALLEDIDVNHMIEHVSAAASYGAVKAAQEANIDTFEAIKAASVGSSSGAIRFAVNFETKIAKAASAAASGSVAGAIEVTKKSDLDSIQAAKIASEGIVSGVINAADALRIDGTKVLSEAANGIAEAAIEASEKERLEIIPQVKAAAIGAIDQSAKSAADANFNSDRAIKAVSLGLSQGAYQALPGNGGNIRIEIDPIEDFEVVEILETLDFAIPGSEFVPPIIQTPFEDDPTARLVSPS